MTGATAIGTGQFRPWVRPQAQSVVLFVVAMSGIAFGQWLLLRGSWRPLALAVWFGGLAAFVWLERGTRIAFHHALDTVDSIDATRRYTDGLAEGRYLAMPLLVAGASGLVTAATQHWISPQSDHTIVVLAWLLSLGALVMAATPVGSVRPAIAAARLRIRHARVQQWGPAAAIFVVAALARLIALGSFPSPDSDGLSLARVGREVLQGEVRDPFSTRWYDLPTLFGYLQAASMRVFGETLFGARFVSMLAGTLAVVATFFWSRRLFGRSVALAAAALLAVLPMHVYFSRLAQNMVEDSLSLVLVLWLLDRAYVHRRPLGAVLAGIALGLSQYFYYSARFLVPLAVALTVGMSLWWFSRLRTWRAALGAVAGPTTWMWCAALLTCLPLAVHFLDNPHTFNSRAREVSITGPWLEEQVALTGDSEELIIARQLGDAALIPFASRTSGPYHPDPPLAGWPIAPAAAAGIAMVTATAWRRRHLGIAMAWWGSLAAVGLTIQFSSQRWLLATPLLAVGAGLGLDGLRRIVVTHLKVPSRVALVGMVCIVVGLMTWNVHFVFRDSNELMVWSDENSLTANVFAEHLADEQTGTVVYAAFAPRMFFLSHSVVPFLAPQVAGNDLLEPLVDAGDVPQLTGRTVFAFLPQRLGELEIVRSVHPTGVTDEFLDRGGSLALVLYTVDQ